MAQAAAAATPPEQKGGKKKKLFLIGGLALALLGGGGAAAFFLLKDQPAQGASGNAAEAGEAAEHREAIYFSLAPSFIVNFTASDSGARPPARFLKIDVDGVTRNPEMLEAIKTHTPMIRNNLIMLFSRQRYEDLIAPEGKEKLRADALAEVQKVMQKETGDPAVEEVFFTSFVMQ